MSEECPRQDSNLRPCLRRAVLYPLSYGGSPGRAGETLSAAGGRRAEALRAPGGGCRRARSAWRSSGWSRPSASRRWCRPGSGRPPVAACSAAYSAISRPPWWCRIISRRNSTSNAVPGQVAQLGELLLGRHPGHQAARVHASSGRRAAALAHPGHDARRRWAAGPTSASQPCIRPAWLVCVEEMSNASPRTAGSSLRSRARLAISTPCRWCRAMSREKPASTESAVGAGPGRCRGRPPARRRAARGSRR